MDQKTPLDHEKTVRIAYFARRNPAIHCLSVTPNHLRKLGYCEVLSRCGSGLGFLPAHDRPARLLGYLLSVEEVLNLAESTTASWVPDRKSAEL